MNYWLLIALLLPMPGRAQSKVAGLGKYTIGLTTPDSLSRSQFKEGEQTYVKGTIALPCTHIRAFTSATTSVAGISTINLVLLFYDNVLFAISCDYSDNWSIAFPAQHGPSVRKTVSRVQLCSRGADKAMLLRGETWSGGDVLALVIHRKGYTADCQFEEESSLTIFSQRLWALSSECDLKFTDPYIDVLTEPLPEHDPKQH